MSLGLINHFDKKRIYLLTSARGKFGLWKMVKKIITYGKRRTDESHNVVCNVGLNVVVLDVGLRNDDVASSSSGGIDSSSCNVFTNNIGIFGQKWFEEEEKEEKMERRKYKVFYVDKRDLFL